MSALSRFGPSLARSLLIQHQRHMASTSTATDPIQRLFVEKIREIKSSNKGLDPTHQRQMNEEMLRLKRVYQVDDENKLAHMDHKFSSEHNVSLHDVETSKELRQKIHSGEYQKQLASETVTVSALIATTPDQTQHDLCLPPLNKPDPQYLIENNRSLEPTRLGKPRPDYEITTSKMTPDLIEREMLVHFGDKMPTIHDNDSPQRDKVNFPRINPALDTPPTRYHVVPESWFQFFYPKTGVTGPYAFFASFGTFLMSKEWLVMEHELLTGISSFILCVVLLPKFGPPAKAWLTKMIKEDLDGWDNWQKGNIDSLGQVIEHYKKQLEIGGDVIGEIYNARKQDIDLQLECEYRSRVKSVYEDTKRRLNYLVAVADSQRQIHHSNMVNMVISNVISSFGPKQESEALEDCIVGLKKLAAKNANAI